MNILIVDDQAINQKLLRATLEAEGHTVAKASDGVEALQLLESHGADAIISDILMPRMDGYRLCSEVRNRKEFKNIPFIHYTATYTSPSDERLSSDVGADVFLRKPAPAGEIIGALSRVTCKEHTTRSTCAIPQSDMMEEYSERLVSKLETKNEELEVAHAELRQLLAHSPAVIYTLTIDGETVTPVVVSDNIERLFGFRVAESTRYEWWLDSLHPDDRERVLSVLAKSLTGEGYSMEYRIRHKDGSYHWVEDNNRMIHGANGHAAKAVGVWTDITERKRAEERLHEQADMINRAQDAIIGCVFEDERITFWNAGAERLYGWSADEAIGRSIGELLYADPKERAAPLKTLLATGEFRGEVKQIAKDGRELLVDGRSTIVRAPDGTPRSILSINTDITERKKLEMQLLRAQRLESIGTLASGVAHDLNNILTPILMCSETLRSDLGEEERQSTIDLIEESARRGAVVMKQILTFARGIEGQRVTVNPRHLIEEMVDIARRTFPKAIEINSRYPEDLWSIKGDPTQLHQVLLNLCVNARDAMPDAGSLIIAAENVDVDDGYAAMVPEATVGPHVLFQVSDTGEGMSRATVDKIFDPFFTTKQIGKGTGLGLSTALGIVKSHGGFLSVDSEIGKGTTFKVFLPAAMSDEDLQKAKAPHAPFQGNSELILVVDDEASIVRVTKTILEKNNYRVISASDGPEALALFAQQMESIRLVLTDLSMPFMDGVVLARALKKMKPDVSIIMSTGQGDHAHDSELEALGIADLMTKPYDTGKLLQTVHHALTSAAT